MSWRTNVRVFVLAPSLITPSAVPAQCAPLIAIFNKRSRQLSRRDALTVRISTWTRNLRTRIRKCVPTKRNRGTNAAFQKHIYHRVHQTISRNKILFANDARFLLTMLACLQWSFASTHFETSRLLRTLYAPRPLFCVRLVYGEICVNATPVQYNLLLGQYFVGNVRIIYPCHYGILGISYPVPWLLQSPRREKVSNIDLWLLSSRSTFSYHFLKEMYKWGSENR